MTRSPRFAGPCGPPPTARRGGGSRAVRLLPRTARRAARLAGSRACARVLARSRPHGARAIPSHRRHAERRLAGSQLGVLPRVACRGCDSVAAVRRWPRVRGEPRRDQAPLGAQPLRLAHPDAGSGRARLPPAADGPGPSRPVAPLARRADGCRGGGHVSRPRTLACVMGDIDLVRALGLGGISSAVLAKPGAMQRYSRHVRASLDDVDAWDGAEELVNLLVRFARSQPEPPVLYYQEDGHLLFVSRFRERLREAFRFVIADATLVEDLVDKARFQALAHRLRLPVPPGRLIDPAMGPNALNGDLRYPI